jgi:hypothetical protein
VKFKDVVRQDIKNVFHNAQEFAENKAVKYDGTWYNIPVIMDYDGAKDRKKPSTDNADGIFLCDATAYIAAVDLPTVPRKDRKIEIEDDIFNITKVDNEAGEIVLYLEMLDE